MKERLEKRGLGKIFIWHSGSVDQCKIATDQQRHSSRRKFIDMGFYGPLLGTQFHFWGPQTFFRDPGPLLRVPGPLLEPVSSMFTKITHFKVSFDEFVICHCHQTLFRNTHLYADNMYLSKQILERFSTLCKVLWANLKCLLQIHPSSTDGQSSGVDSGLSQFS